MVEFYKVVGEPNWQNTKSEDYRVLMQLKNKFPKKMEEVLKKPRAA